jgi:hypothetical protein
MIQWLCRIVKFAPALPVYGAIVIAGKIFAVAPSFADLPHSAGPAMTSHSLAAKQVRLHHADRCVYQEASIARRDGEDHEDYVKGHYQGAP